MIIQANDFPEIKSGFLHYCTLIKKIEKAKRKVVEMLIVLDINICRKLHFDGVKPITKYSHYTRYIWSIYGTT